MPSAVLHQISGDQSAIKTKQPTTATITETRASSSSLIDPEAPTTDGALHKPFSQRYAPTAEKTEGVVYFFDGTVDGEPPFVDFSPGAKVPHNIKERWTGTVPVNDIKTFNPPTRIGHEGCEWVSHPTTLTEQDLLYPDPATVKSTVESKYWSECASMVQSRTGAIKCIPYHWRHRRHETDVDVLDHKKITTKPVVNFHFDNNHTTAETNLRTALGDEEATRWLTTPNMHWQIVNVWRPIGDIASMYPLALIGTDEVDWDRDAATIVTRNNYKASSLVIRYHPSFNFYYAKDLTPDEALIFRDYDSRKEMGLFGMPHAAFDDVNTPEGAPLRRSVEVRVLCLYQD